MSQHDLWHPGKDMSWIYPLHRQFSKCNPRYLEKPLRALIRSSVVHLYPWNPQMYRGESSNAALKTQVSRFREMRFPGNGQQYIVQSFLHDGAVRWSQSESLLMKKGKFTSFFFQNLDIAIQNRLEKLSFSTWEIISAIKNKIPSLS